MKAFLRLNKGLLTKKLNIPDICVRTDFRVPWTMPITANQIGDITIARATMNAHCLVFKWDKVSQDGNGIPILDLVDVT